MATLRTAIPLLLTYLLLKGTDEREGRGEGGRKWRRGNSPPQRQGEYSEQRGASCQRDGLASWKQTSGANRRRPNRSMKIDNNGAIDDRPADLSAGSSAGGGGRVLGAKSSGRW